MSRSDDSLLSHTSRVVLTGSLTGSVQELWLAIAFAPTFWRERDLSDFGIELLTSCFLENLVLSLNFQGGEKARFDHPADAHGFDVPGVQNCLLEFSTKAHP